MHLFPPTIIFRHRRENLKKCSLKGLETREDILFYTYPKDPLPPLQGYILLKLDAPPLTKDDANKGLLLLDGTWRLAQAMESSIQSISIEARSLPLFKTAYPRRQTGCLDPQSGLASIEALFIAYHILQRPKKGLLDSYYWKDAFLLLNELI